MPRIPRQFVPLDMNYPSDRAIQRAGPDAELLYIRGLAYAKANGTDGHISTYDLESVAVRLKSTHARVTALVREGLWEKTDDGWQIAAWLRWNPTQAEIAEDREKKRAAAEKTNHDRYHDAKPRKGCVHCFPTSRMRAVQ